MALKRKYQVLAALEPQPGILASSLVSAANAKILPIDPVLTLDVANVNREIVRGTLTPATPIQGLTEASFTFGVELSGSVTSATTVPVWDILLRACGMRSDAVTTVGIPGTFTTGTYFLHGETITGGTSGGTALVVMDTYEGQGVIRYVPVSGTITTSETITGSVSGAIVTTSGTVVAQGRGYWPVSSNRVQLDYTGGTAWALGDLLQGATSGSLIKALSAETSATGADVEFEVLYGTLTDGEAFAGIAGSTGALTYSAATISYEDFPTLSMALVEDGAIKTLRGCRGTVALSFEIGKPVTMNFEFKGVLSSIADGVAVTGVTTDTPVPPKFLGVDFQVGDAGQTYAQEFTPRISSAGIDLANDVPLRQDATDSTGNLWAEITGRQPTATMDPELLPEASFDWLSKFTTGETFRLRIQIGSIARNRFRIFAPAIKITGEGAGDREGFATRDITGQMSGQLPDGTDGENNELVILFGDISTTW